MRRSSGPENVFKYWRRYFNNSPCCVWLSRFHSFLILCSSTCAPKYRTSKSWIYQVIKTKTKKKTILFTNAKLTCICNNEMEIVQASFVFKNKFNHCWHWERSCWLEWGSWKVWRAWKESYFQWLEYRYSLFNILTDSFILQKFFANVSTKFEETTQKIGLKIIKKKNELQHIKDQIQKSLGEHSNSFHLFITDLYDPFKAPFRIVTHFVWFIFN